MSGTKFFQCLVYGKSLCRDLCHYFGCMIHGGHIVERMLNLSRLPPLSCMTTDEIRNSRILHEHDVRVETYPFPREGVREAIYNALGHNNYAASIPIQIRIEDDAMYISNNCILPKNWTVDTLMKPHKSEPFNPSIAHVFYRAGYIEAWGRGIQKICEACQELGTPDPEYKVLGDDITVKFFALEGAKISESKNPKHQGDVLGDVLEDRILDELRRNPSLNQKELANMHHTSVPSVQRAMSRLKDDGRLIRKGGKRFGYWEIHE